MGAGDPLDTQRYPPSPAAELARIGFDEAQEIGRGGFGVVYRCTQADLDRTVAVKVLTVERASEHRGLLQVGASDRGRPYIVKPYHPQDSLEVRIRRHGPLTLSEALRLGVKMAGAIETAHGLGILHRDVKPANILLSDYGEPELSDFGIAHISGGFETVTGAVTGSPTYTAPEVLSGDPPSPAADVYGLGATLFSALTGHAAFERHSGEQVIAQFLRITTHEVPDLREHGIPDDVSDTIARAMCRTPGQRPASAADFGEELRTLQRQHGLPVDEMALRAEPDAQGNGRHVSTHSGHVSPPSSVLGATGRLPLELSSFIGRRHELTETKNLLTGSRLVTKNAPCHSRARAWSTASKPTWWSSISPTPGWRCANAPPMSPQNRFVPRPVRRCPRRRSPTRTEGDDRVRPIPGISLLPLSPDKDRKMPMGQVITLTFTHDTPEHVFTALSASLDKLTQHAGESNHSDMEGS